MITSDMKLFTVRLNPVSVFPGHTEILTELVSQLTDVSQAALQQNQAGQTWLHLAAVSGNADLMSVLATAGADTGLQLITIELIMKFLSFWALLHKPRDVFGKDIFTLLT